MIHRIYSSLSLFKELEFKSGFNILIAEKSKDATKEQTRNAAGKSSLLEIIHYLLGASSPPDSFFTKEVFDGHHFGLVFDLGGFRVNVERPAGSTKEKGYFYFNNSIPAYIRSELSKSKSGGESYLTVNKWKDILGEYAFGLHSSNARFQPTFRALFPYFCRREENGGFSDTFYQSKKQMDWDRNVMLAYLLGLDWQILSQMEVLRLEEQHLDKLKRELSGSELIGQMLGKSASVRAKLTIAESKLKKFEKEVADFEVLPQYRDFEIEASTLTRTIAELANANTIDLRLLEDLRKSFQEQTEFERADLERLYLAAGVQLPGLTLEKIDSVRAFHNKVMENRRQHLSREIEGADTRIKKRNIVSEQYDTRRQELMGLLQSSGALDQYNRLQAELSRIRSEVEILKRQYEITIKIESGSAELAVNRARLYQNLVGDLSARSERIAEAVILYEQLSGEISECSSVLEIDAAERGLSLKITGGPARSKGIREQQIFCFDMMLAVLNMGKPTQLGFLVHDSHLFDAMDERQVANAIELGARLSHQYGFQYIITMNSDRIPYREFSSNFSLDNYVLPTRLTDETETGGLFGMRF
jgi:uncharacterized protein YydD (DUF2326 family)